MQGNWSSYVNRLAMSHNSVAELSRRSGIPRETLRDIKNGKQEPQLETLRPLASFLNMKTGELVNLVEYGSIG